MQFLFVVIGTVLFSIIVGIFIAVFDKKTCLSESCKRLSSEIREHLDPSVDPCDDFYQFACGKMISDRGSEHNGMKDDTTSAQLLRILLLLKEPVSSSEPEAYAKAKKVFKKCVECNNASEDKVAEIIKKLLQETGGFPTLEGEKWNETGWTWLETMGKIRKRGLFLSALFSVRVFQNWFNHKLSLAVSNPVYNELILCIIGPQQCEEFFNMTFFQLVLGLGGSKEEAERDGPDIYNLQKKLYWLCFLHPDIAESNITKDDATDLTNITVSFDYIDWPTLVRILLQKDYVTNDFEIIVFNPGFMGSLKSVFEATPKKVLANFLMWKVAMGLNSFFSDKKNENACLSFVMEQLSISVNRLYLDNYPEPFGKDLKSVEEMTVILKDEILTAIKEVSWMTDIMKRTSTAKIKYLKQRIGDLKLFNTSAVEAFYRDLSTEGDEYKVMLNTVKFNMDKDYESCNNTSGELMVLSKMMEYVSNAFYFSLDNSINILHGILQPPVFRAEWPEYVNYGRIGTIVGHEITHAVDENGQRFDEHGTKIKGSDELIHGIFSEPVECLSEQFDDFYNSSPLRLGRLNSPENMADTGGSVLASRAYKKFSEGLFLPELLLPDLDYSQDQLFFISFAMYWCSKEDKPPSTGPHAPDRYRVLKTLRNNPNFARAFGCTPNHNMTSGSNCEVW